MIYLISAIIFGSLFSVVFRVCQNLRIDCPQVILFNYIFAIIATAVPAIFKICTGDAQVADYSVHGSSYGFAALQGLLFVAGFSIMDRSTWRSGVAITTVAARASLVIPILLGWKILAQPEPEWLPVVLILGSVLLIVLTNDIQSHEGVKVSSKSDAQRKRRAFWALLSVFLCFGISDFGIKLSQHSVEVNLAVGENISTHLDALMVLIFTAASVFSLVMCIVRGSFKDSPVNWKSILGGIVLGLINLLCTGSSLRALSEMSTDLYYPLYNIGIVLVATLVGVLFFREKIKWTQLAGFALAIAAIVLFFV